MLPLLAVLTLTLDAERGLPVYHPKNRVEEAGVTAALASLDALGEGRTVELILQAAPQLMNLADADVDRVRDQLAARYDELEDDARWKDVPSPLRTAFAAERPSMIVVPPTAADPKTAPVIVFLHGYGGSGKLFPFLVARAIPEAWVVAPSHGLSWAQPKIGYLDRALARFEEKAGLDHPKYLLVGLSDGGVGAFEVLAKRPHRFARAVSIVGIPRAETIAKVPASTPILMLNGKGDRFVREGAVRSRFKALRAHTRRAELEWFEGGHYFLLDDDAKALARARAFLLQR